VPTFPIYDEKCVFHPTMLYEEYTGYEDKPIRALLT
jgi:hypothetical protein